MKVVITDYQYEDITQEKQIITSAGFELFEYQEKKPAALIPLVKDADAIITQYSEINETVIESLMHCKMIIKYGIGVNNIDVEAASKKGIYVCNVPDYGIDEVSNHALTFILTLSKKLKQEDMFFRNGNWGYSEIVPVFRFSGSTIGLMGFGRIPQLVARKLSGFGVNVIAYDPFCSASTFREYGVESVDFNTLCEKSDFISIHCPLTAETQHVFNKDAFSKMKKTACIINTARGPVVDENALIEALENGYIAGAALDVYESEPLNKESKLFSFENVILTPHCAWYSEEAISTLQRKVAEEVVNVLKGNVPLNCVNRKKVG